MCILNALKAIKKIIKILKLWSTYFIVHIPSHTRVCINMKLLVVCRTIVVHFKRNSVNLSSIAHLLVELFNLRLISHKIWILTDYICKIMNKSCLNALTHRCVIKNDKISKVTSCTTRLIKSSAVTRNLRWDNVKINIELILNNLTIPSWLNTLEVSCYIVEINCISIILISLCCSSVITTSIWTRIIWSTVSCFRLGLCSSAIVTWICWSTTTSWKKWCSHSSCNSKWSEFLKLHFVSSFI